LRDVTERPETLEAGSNMLGGSDPAQILNLVHVALNQKNLWNPPEEYIKENVSDTVANILLSYLYKKLY
jgi:UDP-N-acetylglucosamine 2-epimerase (non-hydrolysing)